MDFQISAFCRGEGKIYAKVDIDGCDDPSNVRIEVTSSTKEGQAVPAFCTRIAQSTASFALALPLLRVAQVVELRALGRDGKMIDFTSSTVNPMSAAIKSKVNSRLSQSAVDQIRNIDLLPLVEGSAVVIDEIIADLGDIDIVHGTATVAVGDEAAGACPIQVIALDDKGDLVSQGPWVSLKDITKASREYPESLLRTVQFSLRVPRAVGGFTVWVQCPDDASQQGFCTLEPSIADDHRRNWRESVESADRSQGYERWFLRKHRASARDLSFQARKVFSENPKYSIITPLYHTPLDFFDAMVDSVRAQSYGSFELILVNASPEDAELKQHVARYVEADARIICVELPENRGITENTNEGIKVATGDFLCFFDHDDVLEPDALFEYTKAINDHPDTDMLYCDEDKLKDGLYYEPYFKPDFNIDLLRGINYVCHFLTVRKSLFDPMELPTREYDGAQDYHMTFRIAEVARHVHHVPRVLYHWRVHDHSTASSADEKPYTQEAARLCLETHLQRCGIHANAIDSERVPRHYEVEYILDEKPLVSVVIPNKDNAQVLRRCITSILDTSTYDNYEVVVVENNSSQQATFAYYEQVCADGRVRIAKYEDAFNFSKVINFGVEQAKGDYLVLMNNDTEVITPDWIERMLGPCMRSDMGAVGVKLLFPDGTIQHAGVTVGGPGPGHINYKVPRYDSGYFDTARLSMDLSAVTAACMMTKRSVFNEVGGFDEAFRIDYNDVDYCLKLRDKDYLVLFEAGVELFHYESVSRMTNPEMVQEMQRCKESGLLKQRWPRYFAQGDPYINANLVAGTTYYQLKV